MVFIKIAGTLVLYVISVIGVWNWLLTKHRKKPIFVIIIAMLAIPVVAIIYEGYQKVRKERFDERYFGKSSGRLESQSKGNVIVPKFRFGGATFLDPNRNRDFTCVRKILGYMPFEIWVESGKVRVNTKVKNKKGDIVAQLNANEWQINPDNIFDRNYNQNALEVIGPNKEVILQVILDGDIAEVYGEFYASQEIRIRRNIDRVLFGKAPDGTGIIVTKPIGSRDKSKIPRMFKYPSSKHLGELTKSE